MFPGHPTQLSGRLAITNQIDAASSSNIVIETGTGSDAGVYIDDTTPDLEKWLAIAVEKFALVLVSVAPAARGTHHQPHMPHGPVQNMYEAYDAGETIPTDYQHLIVRWGYKRPTLVKRLAMLERALRAVAGDADRVWLF